MAVTSVTSGGRSAPTTRQVQHSRAVPGRILILAVRSAQTRTHRPNCSLRLTYAHVGDGTCEQISYTSSLCHVVTASRLLHGVIHVKLRGKRRGERQFHSFHLFTFYGFNYTNDRHRSCTLFKRQYSPPSLPAAHRNSVCFPASLPIPPPSPDLNTPFV
jgi:hypothetical protein